MSALRQAVKYAERQNACYALSRQDYADWIAKHYPTRESARHQCKQATINMVAEFPELKRVRGYINGPGSYRHPHWWCTDLAGRVVDPTGHQWPVAVTSENYEALPHDAEEPMGKCINCGDLCFRSRGATAYHCELCLTSTHHPGFKDKP